MKETCRCGHSGEGDHPCHGIAYACKLPAKQRFYDIQPATIQQDKFSARDTWACDDCWDLYLLTRHIG